MLTGQILFIVSIIIAVVLCYINLYTMNYNNNKVKVSLIRYIASWIIAFIPLFGLGFHLILFGYLKYVCHYKTDFWIFKKF